LLASGARSLRSLFWTARSIPVSVRIVAGSHEQMHRTGTAALDGGNRLGPAPGGAPVWRAGRRLLGSPNRQDRIPNRVPDSAIPTYISALEKS
jgi:hypothetical protein